MTCRVTWQSLSLMYDCCKCIPVNRLSSLECRRACGVRRRTRVHLRDSSAGLCGNGSGYKYGCDRASDTSGGGSSWDGRRVATGRMRKGKTGLAGVRIESGCSRDASSHCAIEEDMSVSCRPWQSACNGAMAIVVWLSLLLHLSPSFSVLSLVLQWHGRRERPSVKQENPMHWRRKLYL